LTELLSGNEAIARGIFDEIYCEWSPNEKVAFEVAAGASLAGARAVVTMKAVGLNVAADPLMTFSYIGTVGGFVACVADDPGQHSSQTEQDTRRYAQLARIPVFEPADSQEAKDLVGTALEVSERFDTPVILRSTTRVSHSRSVLNLGERALPARAVGFERDPPRFVPIPIWGRKMRVKVEERLTLLAEAAADSLANRIEWRDRGLGVVAVGIAYQYVREAFPAASVLKLSWCYPFPDRLIREFAAGVNQLLVVEELDDIVEEHVRALGIACRGKDVVSRVGELTTDRLLETRARVEGRNPASVAVPLADAPAISVVTASVSSRRSTAPTRSCAWALASPWPTAWTRPASRKRSWGSSATRRSFTAGSRVSWIFPTTAAPPPSSWWTTAPPP
jgi:indolepyruvate ferredoxin oxidoreductase alpha subunit